jgi:hypothetical protein
MTVCEEVDKEEKVPNCIRLSLCAISPGDTSQGTLCLRTAVYFRPNTSTDHTHSPIFPRRSFLPSRSRQIHTGRVPQSTAASCIGTVLRLPRPGDLQLHPEHHRSDCCRSVAVPEVLASKVTAQKSRPETPLAQYP